MDKTISSELDAIEVSLGNIRAMLAQQAQQVQQAQKPTRQIQPQQTKKKSYTADSMTADALGATPNYDDNNWPEAIPSYMIVKNESEKQFRAIQVVGLMANDFAGLIANDFDGVNILDCGCGDGYISRELAGHAKTVGYDIKTSNTWQHMLGNGVPNKLTYTTSKSAVEELKYDFIIMHDVIDHIEREDPVQLLTWVRSLLTDNGRIFLRAHPWTSKHGGHLYEDGFNKAYLHLALTLDEMARAGFKMQPNLRIARPMAAYEHMFTQAGLNIIERKGHTEQPDRFFTGEILDRIIKVTWRGAINREDALKIMSNDFIDYSLTGSNKG